MELEKIPTEAFTHVLFAFNWESLGLTADLWLLISVDSLRSDLLIVDVISIQAYTALSSSSRIARPRPASGIGASRRSRPPRSYRPSARRSSPGRCRLVCDSHTHAMCLFYCSSAAEMGMPSCESISMRLFKQFVFSTGYRKIIFWKQKFCYFTRFDFLELGIVWVNSNMLMVSIPKDMLCLPLTLMGKKVSYVTVCRLML